MNKQQFIDELRKGLSGLPPKDIDERLSFYSEMIDDRIEEGVPEEEAVAGIGDVNEVVSQIIAETPLTKIVKEKVRPKRQLRAWEIILIILGAPLWIPLLFAAISVILSVYIVLWSLIVSIWAIEVSLIASSFGALISSAVYVFQGYIASAVASVGVGLFCAGASIFLFFGCLAVTKGICMLTKKIALGVKSLFVGKENKNEQN